MEEIKHYTTISDYKLNMGKSEAVVVGQPISQTIQSKYILKWDQNKLKYLGVTICICLTLINVINIILGLLRVKLNKTNKNGH